MKRKERGIETRVLLVALAPVIATAVALTLYFTLLRYNDVEAELQQRGLAMTRQLVAATEYGLFSGNPRELGRLIETLSHEPDVSAISIYNQQGIRLAAVGITHIAHNSAGGGNSRIERSSDGKVLSFHKKVFATPLSFDDPYSEQSKNAAPELLIGSVTVELSRNNLISRKREILLFTVGAALLILLVAGLIAHRLGRDISEPVLALENTVKNIRDGLLSSRVIPHPAGTLHMLETGVNAMAAELEHAQKRSYEALYSSEEKLQQQSDFADALLEAQSKAGVSLVIIQNEKIVFANQAALELSRRPMEDLDHLSIPDTLAPNHRELFNRIYRSILQGETPSSRIEVNLLTPDGTDRWAEVAFFRINHGNVLRIAMVGVDITQRKQDAQQLLSAHQKLQLQKQEAERASEAKSRFLAAASHDLRQPLHALSLFFDQLHEHITTPTQLSIANRVDAAIGSMSELLESLLDISKIDLATLRPNISNFQLGPMLEQTVAAHRQAAENKQLRLRLVQTSLSVSSDPHYLSRILSNLISNAVRYTEQGTVLIGARRSGDTIYIEVWDSGIGIEERHMPFLFQEFYQVANPERDASKGLGLGLAIVDRLAGALGHKIIVRSTPSVGSVFSVKVPRTRPEAIDPVFPVAARQSDAHILITLDNKKEKAELTAMLEHWGYVVLLCEADKIAEALIEPIAHPPDLILCGLSGLRQIDQSLNSRGKARVPIICITSKTEFASNESCSLSFSPLTIPVKPAKLRALILHLLARNN